MGCVSSSSSSHQQDQKQQQKMQVDGSRKGASAKFMEIEPSGSWDNETSNGFPSPSASSQEGREKDMVVLEMLPEEPLGEERLILSQRIRAIPFFSMHSGKQARRIASKMEEVLIPANSTLFTVNSDEDAFYIIKDTEDIPKLSIEDSQGAALLEFPTHFGETCLRYNGTQRKYTLKTKGDVVFYKIAPSTYRNLIVQQAKQQESQFMHFLRRVPILEGLTDEQLQALGRSLQHARFPDGAKIITQGSHGSTFYFVESGTVKCIQRTQKGSNEVVTEVNRYSAGDYFGEGALLQDAPRNADVIAVGEVSCLTLSRNDFNDLLGGIQQLLEHNFRARVLKGVELFKTLTDAERSELADLLVEQVYDPGEQILQQGDVGDRFYIIKEGEVRFTRNPSVSADGELDKVDMLENPSGTDHQHNSTNNDTASAVAAAAAAVAAVAASFSGPVSQSPPPVPQHGGISSVPPMPQAMSQTHVLTSSSSSSATIYSDSNDMDVSGGNGLDVDALRGVKESQQEEEEEEIGRLFTGQYFGEGALLTDAPRRASAYAVGSVTLLTLERSIFSSVFDQTLQDMLNRNFEKRKKEEEAAIEFTDLEQIKVLGAGSYGQVLLVTNKVTGKTYALKTMSKQRIVAMRQQKHVLNEKAILESTSHPFIVSLKQSYISDEYVFVLLEAVLGGELFAYMRAAGRLKLKDALFYIAQVVLVFEYLHSKNIIYRDLKPENLLVAANGYLKFTDFGLSKLLHNDRKTYTLCGTPSYAPPEVYNLSGHGKAADWWTLGVLTHELLSATTPFNGTPEEIFASLEQYSRCYPNIKLPKGLGGAVGDFTLRLLNPNPSKRLGCLPRGAGVRDVKMHNIFIGYSWTKLLQEQLKAPFKPKIRSMYDTDNFYPPVVKGKPVQLANVDPNSVRIAAEWDF